MPTTLEDVLNAPYDYDHDMLVTLSYGNQERIKGFQYASYSSNTGYTWKEENKHLATPQINTVLKEWGYRLVIKRDTDIPFEPQWDYRIMVPQWSLFRLWIYIFYAEEEVKGERTDAERDECMRIMEKVGNLATTCPALHEVHTWVKEQYIKHVPNPNRAVKYLYNDLGNILDNYAGWAGSEKVNG